MTTNAIVADAGAPAPAAGTVAGLIAEVFATLPRPSETEARITKKWIKNKVK
jgi:hypothetical protein